MDKGTTNYEYSKQLMSYETPRKESTVLRRYNDMASWMIKAKDTFFTLLCLERRDMTIFNVKGDNQEQLYEDLKECLDNRGKLIKCKQNPIDCSYEIWIRDRDTNENFLYCLQASDFRTITID